MRNKVMKKYKLLKVKLNCQCKNCVNIGQVKVYP
jgi:hypothetical protein